MKLLYDSRDDPYHERIGSQILYWLDDLGAVPLDEVDRYAVRGQYSAGQIDGKPVPGYREEPDVAANSTTETYAAVRLFRSQD